MYYALDHAIQIIADQYGDKLDQYSPAIIVLSDGRANDYPDDMIANYKNLGLDIPIFSIMFGDASEDQLQTLADLSHARIFDGRTNLIEAFQSVKGYN